MVNGNSYQLGLKFNIQNSSMSDQGSQERTNSLQLGNDGYTPSPKYYPGCFSPFPEKEKTHEERSIDERLRVLESGMEKLVKLMEDLPEKIAEAMVKKLN
jgi:hypothetical protein